MQGECFSASLRLCLPSSKRGDTLCFACNGPGYGDSPFRTLASICSNTFGKSAMLSIT
jgi:hypothetical protein